MADNETQMNPEELATEAEQDEVTFVEDPTFEIDYKGDCAYEVKVVIPVANEQNQSEEVYDELKQQAEVPGFRRGRAPRKLIESKFGKMVKEEVESRLVGAAFKKLIKDNELHPLNTPDIEGLDEDEERGKDEPLRLTMKFEVAPRVELGDYKGLEVERPLVTVADSDVDEYIESLRSRRSIYEPLAEGGAEDGDQVVMDFEGTIDGETFPGGSVQKYPYILGSGRFADEIEAALKGAAAGDERTCTVTFPEDHTQEHLQGKEAEFKIKIHEIKRRVLPELNEDFAKQCGYESLEDMREKVRAELAVASSQQTQTLIEQNAMNAVIANSSFEIPSSLIDSFTEQNFQRHVRRLSEMHIPYAEIEQREDEIRERAREEALTEMKQLVALNAIVEAESIAVSEQDFEQELMETARANRMDPGALSQYLSEDADRRSSYETQILHSKAMKLILDSATFKDVELKNDDPQDASDDETHE